MREVGFLRAAWIVATCDLRLEWRTWETSSASLVFSLAVLLVFGFAFDGSAVAPGAGGVVPGALWTALGFAAVVGTARAAQLERQHDVQSALLLAPVDRGALWAGKAFANWIKLNLLGAIVWPLTAVLFGAGVPARAIPALAVVFLVHGLGLVELGTLFAAVTARVGRGEALLAILLLPAASPLLISAVRCTAAVSAGQPLATVSHWLLAAVGFDALYLFVALLTYELVLEE